MKNYGLAMIISLGFSFLLVIFVYFSYFMIIFEMASSMENYDSILTRLYGLLGGFVFILVLACAMGIFVFVRYIQFMMSLKRAGEDTRDSHLQQAFKLELSAMIATIVAYVFLVVLITFFYFPFIEQVMYEADEFLRLMLLFYLGVGILVLIPIVLQITSGINFAKWAETLSMQQPSNYLLHKMADSVKYIKWGRILSVIPMVYALGPFVVIYGFWTGGKAIMDVYTPRGGVNTLNVHAPPLTSYEHSQSQGDYGGPTLRPVNTRSDVCVYCGAPKANPDAAFCAVCGKEL
ncbi:MAG: hypothetical protein KAR20_17130 [Candidatus Heimdallarchaeota archaeon]|nr:hypothetical protein [Candidatus Heimdallarchaeota archaeon]